MKKISILFSLLLFVSTIHAQQTFYGAGGPIPDLTTVQYPIYVSGLPASINSVYGLENVCLDITHTYDDDISIQLKSPDGNIFMLSDRNGGFGDNYFSTFFWGGGSPRPGRIWGSPFVWKEMPDVKLFYVSNS